MSTAPTTISVGLGERSYEIHVGGGLLARLGQIIAPTLSRPFTVVVTDENVATHHLDNVTRTLAEAGLRTETVVLPAGEATKSFAQLESLTDRLLDLGVERQDKVIALGGGVIGDLTGFSCAILRRGAGFIQVPTTLLAQVDSSVGGKTAINTVQGKNLIGAFHQPSLVVADVGVLATLPRRELLAGYAEVVKYGALGDLAFFEWLEENGAALLSSGDEARALLTQAVAQSCRAKARIVEKDEREGGVRALLNLGHTFGHALEAITGFSGNLLHGEGVAIGMVLAMEMSVHLGLCPVDDAARLARHLKAAGLRTKMNEIDGAPFAVDEVLHHMWQDKKVSGGAMTLILTEGLGKALIRRDVPEGDVRDALVAAGAVSQTNG